MITSRSNLEADAQVKAVAQAGAVASALCETIEKLAAQFELVPETGGIELLALDPLPSGLPNRARIKVFSPRPRHTLIFFYKKSLVPYSRDRYSYGGVDLSTDIADPQELGEWIEFARSGFHPEKRPSRLRRAFPYQIPD